MEPNQVIPIDFGGGVDTKTDPKLVVPGKFLSVENGVFTSPKRVTKRNGYQALPKTIAGGGTLTAPTLVREYLDELVCADSGKLYSFSEQDQVWISRGYYRSCEVSRASIDQGFPGTGYVDSVVIGNYLCSAWSVFSGRLKNTAATTNEQSLYVQVKDLSSNTILTLSGTQPLYTRDILGGYMLVKVVKLSSSSFGVIYLEDVTNGNLKLQIITINGNGTATIGSALNIFTWSGGLSQGNFDAIGLASGGAAVAVYKSLIVVRTLTIDAAGTVTNAHDTTITAIAGPALTDNPISISEGSNGNIWVYCTPDQLIQYFVLSPTLSSVLALTTVVDLGATGRCENIISYEVSATSQTVIYGHATFPAAGVGFTQGPTNINVTTTAVVTSGGVVTAGSNYNHITPYSEPLTISGVKYAVFLYIGSQKFTQLNELQTTFFLVDLSTFQAVARFAFGVENILAYTAATVATAATAYGIGYSPNFVLYGSKAIFPCASVIQEIPTSSFTGTRTPGGFAGNLYYMFDFGSNDTYTSVQSGGVMALGGGMLMLYDGATCAELGFNVSAEINNLVADTSSGTLAAGDYSYLAILQWTDNQGNLHRSQPSLAKAINLGATGSIEITVLSSVLTQKSNVYVTIYRTEKNGTVYYQVNSPIFLDTFSTSFFQYKDDLSDADLVKNLQAYTYPSSSVLDNTTPPPATLLVSHNNRLWFRDDENRDTVWYTKTSQAGVGLSPSGFLTEQLDAKFGNISSIAEMDDKLVLFKENGIFVMAGDGANDVGVGSTLSVPQAVPSDVGCSSFKSCITTPAGIMFKSPKGIYIIARSLGVVYIGMDVEAYNSQDITGATLIDGKSQIRFLTSSGATLLYDYIFQKWSTFTAHTGFSSDLWQGTYVYATTDGNIFKETSGAYLDNGTAYALKLQTNWLALASVQGFQRVRRILMLGDFANGASVSHGVRVQASYDFSSTLETAVDYTFGAASASGVFQYRERLPRQKCDSLSLTITEITTGASSEYIDLTNISLEAMVKSGANKLPASRSVG